jgi:hypothetical protein
MQKKGKYILFNLAEFDDWLSENRFNRAVKLIQDHHTYIPGYKHFTGNNHFQLLEGMEREHIERGFSEIAQNLTTFPDGSIAVCRSIDKIPAGIKGANQAGICIENLGNFDAGGDVMSDPHRGTIIKINALLCREFVLTPTSQTIVYHHWYDLNSGSRTNGTGVTKSCPGSNFFGGNTVLSAETNFIPLIAEELLLLTPESANVTNTPSKTAEVTASTLNVRRGPSTLSPVVKTLKTGIRVNVYEEKEGWSKIHPTEQHWVFGRYLRFV